MRKIINKYWNLLQINPELREIFQNNPLVTIKRKKNLQEVIVRHAIKNGKAFKPIQNTEKENVNPATQLNHHYVASRSLTLVHFEVTKHTNYTPYFTSSTVKANSSFA